MERELLLKLRQLNKDLLKNPDNYLFICQYLQRRFIVTNLDMNNVILPKDFVYKDDAVISNETSYEIISREEYRDLD